MSARSFVTLSMFATLAIFCEACDGSGGTPSTPADEPVKTADAPTLEPAAEPAPKPGHEPPGKVVTDLLTLDLPESQDTFEPGQPLWSAHTTGDPAAWTFGKVTHRERRGRFRVAVSADAPQELPTPFVRAADPALGLRPGFPILVHAEGSARFGRVQSISGDEVRVKHVLGHDEIRTGKFSTTDVRPLGRRALEPGTPVVFSGGGHFFIGTLALATGEKAYVICSDLLELPRTEVTPLDTSKLLKPGDRVVVVPSGGEGCDALDGEVTEMRNGGLQYEVELAAGGKLVVPFGLAALHPSTPRPKSP